jgi:hypothetical protein
MLLHVLHHSPFPGQCVLALNYCPIIDTIPWKPASPWYLLDLDNEMPHSVIEWLCGDVDVEEDEVVVEGAKVPET